MSGSEGDLESSAEPDEGEGGLETGRVHRHKKKNDDKDCELIFMSMCRINICHCVLFKRDSRRLY